jgi:hypothetical protein
MVKKLSRPGRPSQQDLEERGHRPQPLTGQPEAVGFRILRPADERADVEHYWARRAFYAAICSYASAVYDELTQAATAPLVAQNIGWAKPRRDEDACDACVPTLFDQFLAGHNETLLRWCRNYAFFVGGEEEPENDRIPTWLWADVVDSFIYWHPKEGSLPLRAIWRGRTDPVEVDGQLVESDLDSAEARAVLRIELVRTEVEDNGAAVPVVISRAEAKAELVQRFAALVDLNLSSLFIAAANCGIHQPSEASLETIMRRYVLKQFRRLDSVEIAAGEARGDPACRGRATDTERQDLAGGSRRRDVDDAIQQAADMLGVPARRLPPGPRPKRRYRNIVHRKR